MTIYTIGYEHRTAREFFDILKKHKITTLIDIRRLPNKRMAGYAQKDTLEYIVTLINAQSGTWKLEYKYIKHLAPSYYLLQDWRKKKMEWDEFKEKYYNEVIMRHDRKMKVHTKNYINYILNQDAPCLMCFEQKPDHCHRKILTDFMQRMSNNCLKIVHL